MVNPNVAAVETEPQAAADPLEDMVRLMLIEVGEDHLRAGLRDTPARFARWWREFFSYDPGTVDTVFPVSTSGETVVVSDIEVWSLCEHHLLPFSCSISIAYRPSETVLGLSKFARIAHRHAHKLQIQERLVQDIASEICKVAGTDDVAVIAHGQHLCMAMRGIRTPAVMTSSYLGGIFEQHGPVRQELMSSSFGTRQ